MYIVYLYTSFIYMTRFSRTVLSEKKTVLKPKSPEKTKPDEKDPEKSPAKKLEGHG